MGDACYRELRRYKYQLVKPYSVQIGIKDRSVNTEFLKLGEDGILTIKERYAWDGPSGPTIDTLNFMRGSLVHDAIYQLIRMKELPYGYRKYADLILK